MERIAGIVTDKRKRSVVVLIITVVIILAINSLLPVIEGDTHFTEDSVTVDYSEYVLMKERDKHYNLTWMSKQKIEEYKRQVIRDHPELSTEETYSIVPPDNFKVEVYTKYFFQYPVWYMTTLTHMVSAILLFYSVFNYFLSKSKQKDERFLSLVKQMDALSESSLDPITFEPWMVDPFNKDRKIKQHIANIKYALDKLEHRTDYHIRLLAKTDSDNPKCAKYIKKRNELQSYLSDEYINNNVVLSKVKDFTYIHPSFVTSGVNVISKVTDSFSLIRTDRQRLNNDSFKKILSSVSLTVLFAALLTITVFSSLSKPWYWFLFDLLVTIAPLILQIPLALEYSETFMSDQLIPNLISRRTIALLYLAAMKEGKDENITEDRPVDTGSTSSRGLEQRDSGTL